MKFRLPPLHALRAFEAASRHESFTQAAEELSVTPGAISRHVANLERELGVELFRREYRAVRLTRAGLVLRDELTNAFSRMASAIQRIQAPVKGKRYLRISAPPAFSVRWLIPKLADFQKTYPDVVISLSNSVASPDFASDQYDLAIRRFSRLPKTGLHAMTLFDEMSVPVCHAELIKSADAPISWIDLLSQAPLLRVGAEPRGWAKWAKMWQVDLAQARFIDVEQTYLAVQAVIDGLGVALLPLALVYDDVKRGLLDMPLGLRKIDASRYYAVTNSPPARGSPKRCMLDWLERQGEAFARRGTTMVKKDV